MYDIHDCAFTFSLKIDAEMQSVGWEYSNNGPPLINIFYLRVYFHSFLFFYFFCEFEIL